jgi:hypothetical protein
MAPHSRSGQNQGCPFCGGKRVLQGFNDLATTHPDFASEADGWDSKTVSAGSHIVQNWKCKEGHKFRVNPNQRTSNKSNCPTCANLKILVGFNDLSTLYPNLASEANGWDPKTVGGGSSKRFSWKCQASGHVWESTIINRTANGSNCPVCVGQLVISGINDLSTTHVDLAKEADGWDPKTLPAGSKKRVQWKCSKGHLWVASVGSRAGAQKSGCPVCGNKKVLIGFNDLATTHPDLAKEADGWNPTSLTAGSEKKVQWICSQRHDWKSVVKNRTGPQKQGCPVCRNLKVLVGYNDLATTHPDLAKEADGWDTSTIVAGTSQKKNWKCKLGHSYKASVVSRSNQDRQSGCPVCDGKIVLAGFNDIATTHPELAKQAVDWDTTKVTSGSSRKKLKWKCNEGHVWETTPNIRTGGSGCPTCASTGFDPNQNAYLYFLVQPNWEIYQIGITNVPKTDWVGIRKMGLNSWNCVDQWMGIQHKN